MNEYVEAFNKGLTSLPENCDITHCYGRLAVGSTDADFTRLNRNASKRLTWIINHETLRKFLTMSHLEMLINVGHTLEWIKFRLEKNEQFKLVLFSDSTESVKLATWDNIFECMTEIYPEIDSNIWYKYSNQLKTMKFNEIDPENTIVKNYYLGPNSEKYMTTERFLDLEQEPTLFDVRSYLHNHVGLNELFRGDGRMETIDGIVSDQELERLFRVFRRMISSIPTSHFLTLKNRPIVQQNGEISHTNAQFHYWQWNGHEPTVLFCHGISFHGRCYDRIINQGLHGCHVIALDFRGHGRSQKHVPPYKARWFGEDTFAFIEEMQLSKMNLIGIGHSLGGYALTLAAAMAPKRLFKSLLLLDPSIFPQSFYGNINESFDFILRRKNQWSSIDEMVSRFSQRQPFSRWPIDTLRDYCTYGVNENFNLQCAPANEASMYETGIESQANIFQLIQDSKYLQETPVHIVRSCLSNEIGNMDSSTTAPDLVTYFKQGQDRKLEVGKHLFPMEQPDITIDIVKKFVNQYQNRRELS